MGIFEQLNAQVELESQDLSQFTDIEQAQGLFDSVVEAPELLDDEAAFNLVMNSMDYMRAQGEFDRIREAAMILGAMACLHGHAVDMAEQFANRYEDVLNSATSSDSSKDDDEKKSKNKKKKRTTWFGLELI